MELYLSFNLFDREVKFSMRHMFLEKATFVFEKYDQKIQGFLTNFNILHPNLSFFSLTLKTFLYEKDNPYVI